jgi:hypothetical protein
LELLGLFEDEAMTVTLFSFELNNVNATGLPGIMSPPLQLNGCQLFYIGIEQTALDENFDLKLVSI